MPPVQLLLKNFGLECHFKPYTRVIPIWLFSDIFTIAKERRCCFSRTNRLPCTEGRCGCEPLSPQPGGVFGEGNVWVSPSRITRGGCQEQPGHAAGAAEQRGTGRAVTPSVGGFAASARVSTSRALSQPQIALT